MAPYRTRVNSNLPVGLGEPAFIVVAPAIGPAIYLAVGVRVKDVPIPAKAVEAAL